MITVLYLRGAVFSLCCLSVSVLSLYYLNYSTISSERDKKILLLLTFNPGLALTTQARLNTKYLIIMIMIIIIIIIIITMMMMMMIMIVIIKVNTDKIP